MLCRIADGSGFLTLRFFYFTAQQQQGLARGARVRCFGEARRGPKGLEFVHPEYRRVDPNAPQPPEEHLTPIYPMTEGVTQGRLRLLVKLALEQTGARRPQGLAAAGGARRFAPAPLREALAVCAPPAHRRAGGAC